MCSHRRIQASTESEYSRGLTEEWRLMRTAEQEAILRSVRKLVSFWQITADELAGIPEPVRVETPPPPEPTTKYRHPITGETWDGEGSQPQWLREALTREGYTVEEVRLPAQATADS
ncbi:MAG: H-NS histone family protein [Aquabacterium sp.]